MSYILDALRKADAQRQGSPAHGIHAQVLAPPQSFARRAPGVRARGWLAGIAVALGLGGVWLHLAAPDSGGAGGLALQAAGGPQEPAPAAAATAAQPRAAVRVAETIHPPPPESARPAAARAAATAVLRTAASPAAPAPAVPPRAAAEPAVLQVAAATPPKEPTAAAAALKQPAVAAAAPPKEPAAAAAPLEAAAAAAPLKESAAAAAARILTVPELPPAIRRDLPALQISGGVHSDDAAQRRLIVAGQVVAEGAQLASGVVLQEIRPRSVVLSFRGWRYSLAY